MKQKIILILFSILLPAFIYTQTTSNNDSLPQILNDEINFSKSTSDIVWERIVIPENKELETFKVLLNNNLYIGCSNGGVYKFLEQNESWDLIGLENYNISGFEVNEGGNLLIVANGIYSWDENSLEYLSDIYCNPLKNTYGIFFGAAYFDVVRSLDGCHNWETVNELQGVSEVIKAFNATSSDSIFMGTTKYTGNGGGVYLSVDGGNNWNHFGLYEHFIASLAVDNFNQVYAGNNGHYQTGQGGLYRFNYETEIWDSLFYFPYITTIVFNSENHIYTGFNTSGMEDWGGVMHSEDNGETWVLDTVGMGNTGVSDLQLANNGTLYALTGYTSKKLYRTTLPVNINENIVNKNFTVNCFPNPVNSILTIKYFTEQQNKSVSTFTIYNSSGIKILNKKLSKEEIENGIIKIDVSSLNKGVYIYKIQCESYNISNKFTKQ